MENQSSKNHTFAVMAIGLSLLILVVLLTFLRPVINKKTAKKNEVAEIQNGPEKSAPKISPKELFQKLSASEPINVLDIRDEGEFKTEHIVNSKNVMSENVEKVLEKEKFYVLIDEGNSGIARNLAALLKENKAGNIYYLEGGFQEWKGQNFPTISEGNPNLITDQSKVSFMSPDDLKSAMEKEASSLMLIDVRNTDIFAYEHLKNAINIPLPDIEKRQDEVPSGKKIIVYDNSGNLSFQGAVRLFDMSIYNVYVLGGGMDAWKQKGYEITR